jgi:uncharacterized protein YwgA
MTRRDWLMLFISFEGAPRGLDPVRLQKGMFLFGQEVAEVPPDEKYTFRPYNYGPMSKAIYDDLDGLVADGLVEKVAVEGQAGRAIAPRHAALNSECSFSRPRIPRRGLGSSASTTRSER